MPRSCRCLKNGATWYASTVKPLGTTRHATSSGRARSLMSTTDQMALRLPHAPDATTVELLYRTFGDVLIPLDKVRVQYFRNLNEDTFAEQLKVGRICLPITTLDNSQKAPKFAHIRHVAALIDSRAYLADEKQARQNEQEKQ